MAQSEQEKEALRSQGSGNLNSETGISKAQELAAAAQGKTTAVCPGIRGMNALSLPVLFSLLLIFILLSLMQNSFNGNVVYCLHEEGPCLILFIFS